MSWLLIILEVVLFLSYSLPFPRFKNKLWLSNIVDAGYAYLIPFLLSYYTFCLFTEETVGPVIYLLAIAVFVIGLRNIFIHQINDALKDKITGLTTLPCYLTKSTSCYLLQLLLFHEWLFINLFSFGIVKSYPLVILWLVFYNGFVIYHAFRYKFVFNSFQILTHRKRHFSDNVNQIGFPLFALIILASYDLWWLILLPIHLTVLTPKWIFYFPIQNIQWLRERLLRLQKDLVNVLHNAVRSYVHYLRLMVNYSIYYLFRLFGVDLKNENLSALQYLKNKWINHSY